ncbi:NAD(P)/FAD-dependent oxidoreductase [Dermatobacter hominis]|uniref:NAD(P)/FAD-dependent oxidoreductase n=1 Tax=Dermatobacter hominis TaxID=2884263 RepID=UPI001D102198|nr:NAD(P)/FAD-dependent oxidoreductase [Dermatobacter hominis]UDY36941.1 NAD(P)/FAD-dependent oxidoreductase [Dermatobacter hominis]
MDTLDVAVVGAGPAGTAAAITLARAGIDVTVFDKATFPRDKTCGDGLTTLALRQLEDLGLDPSVVDSWIDVHECWVTGPSGHAIRLPMPGADQGRFAAVATRLDLDAALVDLARKEGVTVLDGTGVLDAAEDDDGVVLRVSADPADGTGAVGSGGAGRELRARWVVAADGMWSPVRRALGLAEPGYRGDWHAFRQYVRDVGDRAASELHVRFEADLLPGYFWSFPLEGRRANIGFGIQRGGKVPVGDMGPLWEELLRRPAIRDLLGPDATPEAPHRAWPIPARVDSSVKATRRTLFVGDAVGACDVMTGEGIGQALLTGVRAGECIRDRAALGDAADRYAAAVEDELLADHRMSALLVRALQHRKGARAAIRVAGATPWTRRHFARWLFEDSPRGLPFTPSRWRRGVLSGPGAYRDAG